MIKLSEDVKLILLMVGYVGVCVGISYAMYRVFAIMVGKEVVRQLITAGIIAVV